MRERDRVHGRVGKRNKRQEIKGTRTERQGKSSIIWIGHGGNDRPKSHERPPLSWQLVGPYVPTLLPVNPRLQFYIQLLFLPSSPHWTELNGDPDLHFCSWMKVGNEKIIHRRPFVSWLKDGRRGQRGTDRYCPCASLGSCVCVCVLSVISSVTWLCCDVRTTRTIVNWFPFFFSLLLLSCRSGTYAQAIHRLPRFETGQHPLGRARPRPHLGFGTGLRLLQEKTARQRVSWPQPPPPRLPSSSVSNLFSWENLVG